MRALDRKLARDLWRLRAPLLAVSLVMAAGVASLVMAWSTGASLARSRATYYAEGRFADVFAPLKRAPESLAARLASVEGVAAVQTRVVHDATVSLSGAVEVATARLVSVPDEGEPALNGVLLRRGRMPRARMAEAVASEPFAAANRLEPGSKVWAVIGGKRQELTIVGIGLSPEFVYFVRPGEMLPDNRRSGVMWLSRSTLEEAVGMEGAFNDVAIRLTGDASAAVIGRVDALLDRYGGVGAYDRTDHVSDRYLRDELDQLAVMGTWTPAIFLGVGGFLVNVVLGRLVRTQREQIATLKAFGYSNAQLARHVVLMAMAVCACAAAVGVPAGAALGAYLTTFYVEVFRFPLLTFRLDAASVAIGVAVALATSIAGVLGSLRLVTRLAPADAMRPEAPREFGSTILEKFGVRRVPIRWRMGLRDLWGHPWRSALAALGIGMSAAVLIVSSFAFDSVEFMIDREYGAGQRYDMLVTFNEPVSDRATRSLQGMAGGGPGISAEPLRMAGAEISSRQVTRTVAVTGVDADAELMRLLDREGRRVEVPAEGLMISEHFARVLRVAPGDSVRVKFLEGRRAEAWVPVAGVFSGYVGLTAYMDRGALNRLTGDGHVASAVMVSRAGVDFAELHRRLAETPSVAAVSNRRGMVEGFRAMIAQNIVMITLLHAVFAGVITFGVVYNTARVAFAERRRELATLRVLGFTRAEVGRVLLGQILLLTVVGVPIGLVLGRVLAWLLVRSLQTESYELPLVISTQTYAFAALVTGCAALGSALVVRRGVAQLDLLATLKEAG